MSASLRSPTPEADPPQTSNRQQSGSAGAATLGLTLSDVERLRQHDAELLDRDDSDDGEGDHERDSFADDATLVESLPSPQRRDRMRWRVRCYNWGEDIVRTDMPDTWQGGSEVRRHINNIRIQIPSSVTSYGAVLKIYIEESPELRYWVYLSYDLEFSEQEIEVLDRRDLMTRASSVEMALERVVQHLQNENTLYGRSLRDTSSDRSDRAFQNRGTEDQEARTNAEHQAGPHVERESRARRVVNYIRRAASQLTLRPQDEQQTPQP